MAERDLLAFRRQIGFVFQEGALFDSMTVGENVAYRLLEDRVKGDEIELRVREVLRFVELEHTLDLFPSELSGGMRRRVSIARALINQPPIVLYDSPTAGLDPVTSQTIITLILRLARRIRRDGSACDATASGRFRAGELSLRRRIQTRCAQRVQRKCGGRGQNGGDAFSGFARWRSLFRGRPGRTCWIRKMNI